MVCGGAEEVVVEFWEFGITALELVEAVEVLFCMQTVQGIVRVVGAQVLQRMVTVVVMIMLDVEVVLGTVAELVAVVVPGTLVLLGPLVLVVEAG